MSDETKQPEAKTDLPWWANWFAALGIVTMFIVPVGLIGSMFWVFSGDEQWWLENRCYTQGFRIYQAQVFAGHPQSDLAEYVRQCVEYKNKHFCEEWNWDDECPLKEARE